MELILNGERQDVGAPCSVAELLVRRGLGERPCAVEVNRELVPKARHADHRLADGDSVEIVTLVGGG